MRLNKSLFIGNKEFLIVSDDLVLSLYTPGKAKFVVETEEKPAGIVTFHMGYAGLTSYQYFVGYIEKAIKQSANSYHITCSELSNFLQVACPISLNHCTIEDVLKELSTTAKLSFLIPDASYATKKVARFFNTGTGFDAIKNIGNIFNIDDYVWQQQGDGSIYVGSWVDSYWFDKPLEIDEQFFISAQANSATLAINPAIRPGCQLNDRRISKIRHTTNQMTVTFE